MSTFFAVTNEEKKSLDTIQEELQGIVDRMDTRFSAVKAGEYYDLVGCVRGLANSLAYALHVLTVGTKTRRYCVQACVTTSKDGWKTFRQVPTFYLDAEVQGITSIEHAEKIARDILRSGNPDLWVSVNVSEV